jgi:hypothetical protein
MSQSRSYHWPGQRQEAWIRVFQILAQLGAMQGTPVTNQFRQASNQKTGSGSPRLMGTRKAAASTRSIGECWPAHTERGVPNVPGNAQLPLPVGADIHQAHQQAAGPNNAPFSSGGQASVLAVQAGDGNQVQMNPTVG